MGDQILDPILDPILAQLKPTTNYTLLARAYLSTSGLPEVLSYESTFEHFTLLFLSPEAQNELERHFPPPIIFSSVAEQPTLARTCIFA